MVNYCPKCGAQNVETAQFCQHCQSPLPYQSVYQHQQVQPQYPGYGGPPAVNWQAEGADKKLVAGLCGILIGGLGVHKFILGYTTQGLIMLLATVLTCGIAGMVTGVIGLVEGIIYLTKSDEEFVRTYIQAKKGWF